MVAPVPAPIQVTRATEKIVSGRFCVDREGVQVELTRAGYTFVIDDARERRAWTTDQQILIDFLRSQDYRALVAP